MITHILKKLYNKLFQPRWLLLQHPDSAAVQIGITRTWVGRLFKPADVATEGEVIDEFLNRGSVSNKVSTLGVNPVTSEDYSSTSSREPH